MISNLTHHVKKVWSGGVLVRHCSLFKDRGQQPYDAHLIKTPKLINLGRFSSFFAEMFSCFFVNFISVGTQSIVVLYLGFYEKTVVMVVVMILYNWLEWTKSDKVFDKNNQKEWLYLLLFLSTLKIA
jgi:hypothetical protein